MNVFTYQSRVTAVGSCALYAAMMMFVANSAAQPPSPSGPPSAKDGITVNEPEAFQGYSLVAPMNSTETYLIDMEGRIVSTWKSEFTPALGAYLLPNGHLLRPGAMRENSFRGPGSGGRIQEFNWDGELLWDFTLSTERNHPHHDICPLPNGNVLVIAWDKKTKEEAIAAGRRPELVRNDFLPDCILEIHPTGKTTGDIVWEWHAWDHLIQDVDVNKPNYGEVSEHPELIDINYSENLMAGMLNDPQQLANLRSLGYVGGGTRGPNANDAAPTPDGPPGPNDGPPPDGAQAADDAARPDGAPGPDDRRDGRRGRRGPGFEADWMHTNAVDYNADLDQIMISLHSFSEVWIIDHSTTTAEAASHSGGRYGKGGDLLYRWGNPRAYRNGTHADQKLFAQHNAHWIQQGLPGAGHMLVFNNGNNRPHGMYSTVDEVELPTNGDGTYAREEFQPFGPEKALWSYAAPEKSSLFSMTISGAQRLANGNTLICSGNNGLVFEVTPELKTVWQYKHPGAGGPFGMFGPRPGELLPGFLRGALELSDEQNKTLDALEADVKSKLDTLLTDDQREQLSRPRGFGPPRGPFGAGPPNPDDAGDGGQPGPRFRFTPPKPGEVLPDSLADSLKLSDEQTTKLSELQRHVDAEFDKLLTKDQKVQLDEMQQSFRGGPGGPRFGFGPPGFGPPGSGPPADGRAADGGRRGRGRGDRRGGPGGPGGPGGLFRSYRYTADYSGLTGKDLTPGEKLVDVLAKQNPRRPDGPPPADPN
jgi:hypothetical protein